MRMTWAAGMGLALGAGGCGIVEGSEASLWCEVVSTVAVDDPSVGVMGLPPLQDALDGTVGSFDVSAEVYRTEVDPGRLPGRVTLARAGDPWAEDRRPLNPEDWPLGEDPCPSVYAAPYEVTIDLGGAFGVVGEVVLEGYAAADDEVVLGSREERPWWDISEVDSTLDLRNPRLPRDPNRVSVNLQDGGVWPPRVAVFLGLESTQRGWDAWRFMDLWPVPLEED